MLKRFLWGRIIHIAMLSVIIFAFHEKSYSQIGPYRGVSLLSLNGYNESSTETNPQCAGCTYAPQNLYWILDNLDNSQVMSQLTRTFYTYRQAKINLIRLFLNPQWPGWRYKTSLSFPNNISPEYPTPSVARKNAVLRLMDTAYHYGIKTEILFGGPRLNQAYTGWGTTIPTKFGQFYCQQYYSSSPQAYNYDMTWINNWMNVLNGKSNLALVEISFEIVVDTLLDGTKGTIAWFGDSHIGSGSLLYNHGAYAATLWSLFRNAYPNVPASVEILCNRSCLDPKWNSVACLTVNKMQGLKKWFSTYCPGAAYANAELYLFFPPGTGWQQYSDTVTNLLNAYDFTNGPPLWIDEFGMCIGHSSQINPITNIYTETDQTNYIRGVLAGIYKKSKQFNNKISPVLWDGSYDSPFDGGATWGIFSGYDVNNYPIKRLGWNWLMAFYNPESIEIPYKLLLGN
jgi:hypothetical protein